MKIKLPVGFAALLAVVLHSPASAAENDALFVPYGFVTASVWLADHGIASIGGLANNFSAPVASGLDRGDSDRINQRNRGAFEVQQSRFGFQIMPKAKVRGKLEFDFFNASNGSPSTASLLRLRIAKVEWLLDETNTLFIGQDWDLFNAGINPYTHNWVGNYFQGGNVGFMRQQLGFLRRLDKFELGVAAGLAQNTSANTGAFGSSNPDSDTASPSLAVRASYLEGKTKVGAAAIFANRISAATVSGLDSNNSHEAFGTVLFSDTSLCEGFVMRTKLFWGQNLKDIGALGMSAMVPGTAAAPARSTHELGGFISAYRTFSEIWGASVGFGYAKIPESEVVANDALIRNWHLHLGADYFIPESKAKVFIELSRYASQYKLAGGPNEFTAFASQIGLEMGF